MLVVGTRSFALRRKAGRDLDPELRGMASARAHAVSPPPGGARAPPPAKTARQLSPRTVQLTRTSRVSPDSVAGSPSHICLSHVPEVIRPRPERYKLARGPLEIADETWSRPHSDAVDEAFRFRTSILDHRLVTLMVREEKKWREADGSIESELPQISKSPPRVRHVQVDHQLRLASLAEDLESLDHERAQRRQREGSGGGGGCTSPPPFVALPVPASSAPREPCSVGTRARIRLPEDDELDIPPPVFKLTREAIEFGLPAAEETERRAKAKAARDAANSMWRPGVHVERLRNTFDAIAQRHQREIDGIPEPRTPRTNQWAKRYFVKVLRRSTFLAWKALVMRDDARTRRRSREGTRRSREGTRRSREGASPSRRSQETMAIPAAEEAQ